MKSGETVLVDPETTIQRITLIFFAFTNVGAFLGIATSYAEKRVGFWLAYLLPGIVYFLLPIILALTCKRTIRHPPNGSELTNAFRIVTTAVRRNNGKLWVKDFWEKAKPFMLANEGVTTWKGGPIPWNDKLVDDVRRFVYWRPDARPFTNVLLEPWKLA